MESASKGSNKTILITGGAGFIGSHLILKYLHEGHRVICLDNLQTTRTPKNIKQFFKHPQFRFIQQDVIDPIRIDEPINWIFNLACSGSYTSYQFDPVHTVKTNTVGVINVLELARRKGARVLQASTSEIYGDPEVVPQSESYKGSVNTLGPRACYDEGKRVAETLCMDYHREYGTDVKIIRIFNTYGPQMDQNDGRAVTNFIMNALSGKDIVIYGDGSATRSFQYIDDLVQGIDVMMQKENFIGPVNLGNPGEITMKDLAEKVIALLSSASKIVYDRPATDDPKRRCPDIALAERELGWKPHISLDEGLLKTVAYFKTLESPEKKVLVFATTYYPQTGPAEQALMDLANEMPDTSFHIVTTRMNSGASLFEKRGNSDIHRVGIGRALDKYFLPLLGVLKARQLHRMHGYTFAWAVMGSYSGLSVRLLKFLAPDLIVLVSLHESELKKSGALKDFVYRRVIQGADSVHIIGELQEQSPLLASIPSLQRHTGNAKSLMNLVHHTYAELLNRKEKKLSRAK